MPKGGGNGRRRRGALHGELDWQTAGYHMEEVPSDSAELTDSSNDPGYRLPQRNPAADWHDDGGEGAASSSQRVEDFGSHLTDFIGHAPEAVSGPETQAEEQSGGQAVKEPAGLGELKWDRSWGRIAAIAALVLLLVAGGAWIAVRLLTRVDYILVSGNRTVSAQTVISLSGLETGRSILSLDQAELSRRIGEHPKLILVSANRPALHTVELVVQEREDAAYITVNGYVYVLDYRGVVLSEYRNLKQLMGDKEELKLLRVGSMDAKRCRLGHRIEVYNEKQLTAYTELMIEIQVLGLTDVVSEIYVGDLNNVSLATWDGYSVHFGPDSELHEKLMSMELTRQHLITVGIRGGTIDVSDYENPTHIPETSPESDGAKVNIP